MKKTALLMIMGCALATLLSCLPTRAEQGAESAEALGQALCKAIPAGDVDAILALGHPAAVSDLEQYVTNDGQDFQVALSTAKEILALDPLASVCKVEEAETYDCDEDDNTYLAMAAEEDEELFSYQTCGSLFITGPAIDDAEAPDDETPATEEAYFFIFQSGDRWYLDVANYLLDYMEYSEDQDTEEEIEDEEGMEDEDEEEEEEE